MMLNLILKPVRDCIRRTVINILHSLLLVFKEVITVPWQKIYVLYPKIDNCCPNLYTNINANY